MARARNIKPGFFKNEDLAECSLAARLCFAGLWTLADREGRLEDRPKRIKAELFAFDSIEVGPLLGELEARGFLLRYQIDGERFIQISKFHAHQTPHYSEKKSVIKPPKLQEFAGDEECSTLSEGLEKDAIEAALKGVSQPPDSLNPSSLNPDSPIADSPNPDAALRAVPSAAAAAPAPRPKRSPKEKPPTADTWEAYATAYRNRYGAEPVRNAAVNGQLANLVGKLGAEAPDVARFYVGHQRSDYVKAMHDTSLLLRDASGLRTQWATQRTVTTTQANQADKTQTNLNAFAPLIAEAKAREAEDAQRAAA